MTTAAHGQAVADLVIVDLAASECALAERVAVLEADNAALRELNRAALGLLHEREQESVRQQRMIESLRDELRRYVRTQIGVAA